MKGNFGVPQSTSLVIPTLILGLIISCCHDTVESSLIKKPQPFYTVNLFKDQDIHGDGNNETTSVSPQSSVEIPSKKLNAEESLLAQEKKDENTLNNINNNSKILDRNYENLVGDIDGARYFTQYKNELRANSYAKAIVKDLRASRPRQNASTWQNVMDWSILENLKKEQEEEEKGKNSQVIPKKIVCYYNVPTFQDRPFAIFPEQIDPFMCTHIIVGFAHVANSTVQPSDLKDYEFYNRTVGLKQLNKDLKVMLSVGGAGNNNGFPEMVSTNTTRALFIQSCMDFIKKFSFDGLDYDWEFPSWSGKMEEKDKLLTFFQEFRAYTVKVGIPIILSAAVPSPKAIIDLGYDIPKLAEVLDFVNVMTYDYHFYTWYTPFTGPNAPLFKSSSDIGVLTTLNTAWSAKYWYQSGMPAHKIVVGVPTYGHTFKLVDKTERGYGSLALDIGTVGSRGYINYPEICQFLQGNNSQTVFDNETRVPYAFDDQNWISYDNEQSVTEKAQWVKDYYLGGVMVYSINADDAWKICNTSKVTFPLIHAMKTVLFPNNADDF